ncbi:OmpA/MotB protein [Candidatus Moduliflexus flocculans]|uniref:OmpA/MotB protein n=1 Tax=Candidatus Moduliflexus flocculans TaxID=1499966 RepID=A0A0S6VWL4_9BACT|nr:OmpA/MotB protein [Candidatus Moduliflexus flocculans]
MGKQSSVFLALTILTTIAAGIGFFLFYQKQQEAVQIYEKSQRLTSRLEEVDEKLKKTEDALKDAQMKLQQSSRTLQAPTDQHKITALEEELQRTTDALHALQAQQPLDTGTNDEIKAFQDTIADQQQQIDELRMKIEEQEQKITEVSAENTELKAQAAAKALPTPTAEPPVATPTASDDHQAEREALVASVQDKESKIEDLMRQLTQNQTRLSELETQLAEKQATPGQQRSETPVASDQAKPSNHDQVKLLETLQAELASLSEKMGEQERMTQEHVAMLQQQQQAAQEQLMALQQQHQADQEQLTALQQQHQRDLEQLTSLQQHHQELQGQLTTLQQQHQEDQKQLATLQQQYQQSQEQFAALLQENQHNQEQLAVLKQQNQEQLATLQAAKEKALSLQADLQTQEEEYRKLKEAHDLSLANLQAEIASGTLEKETIQTRLSDELERSNKEYQERLDSLAKKKEDEIQQLKSVAETYQNLTRDLEKQIEDKTVRIEQIQQKLRVVIVDQILFASGSAQISNDGLKVLKTIGDELKLNLDGRQIGIEGHTDNKVISKRLQSRYATNWELSSARATNVLRYLQDTLEIPGSQLFAVGYGSHRPVADNSTEEGRRLNRRIEIVLTPQLERSKIEE